MAVIDPSEISATEDDTPKLVLFGGTFDPFHNGHIAITRWLRDTIDATKVILIPAGDPYLRDAPPVASASDRLRMVQLATADEPGIEVSDIDIVREGPTYSIDTVRDMRDIYGEDAEYLLAIGVDAANSLHRWHQYDELAAACTFLIIQRPGSSLKLSVELPTKTVTIRGPMLRISASEIRHLYGSHDLAAAATCVSNSVHAYIIEKGVY